MKGQSAIEFLSLVSLSALMMAALYGLTLSKQQEISQYRETQVIDIMGERYGFQIEMALVQGEGYSRVFSVPERISGMHYNISAGHSKMIVETDERRDVSTTLYEGDWVNVSTRKANVFKVLNNGSIHVVQAE